MKKKLKFRFFGEKIFKERNFDRMNLKFLESQKYFFINSLVLILFLFFFQINCGQSEKNSIQWFREKEKVLKTAQSENKKIILFFQKSKCSECKELEKSFDRDEEVRKNQKKFIFLKIEENDSDFDQFFTDDRYSELKIHDFLFVVSNSSEEILLKTEKFGILVDSLGKM